VSRLSRSRTWRTWRATSSGSITSRRNSGLRRTARCGNPSVSTNPGFTVWTRMPRGRRSAVADRENASAACFDAEYGPDGANAAGPAAGACVAGAAPAPRSGRGGNGGGPPEGPQLFAAHELLEPLRLDRREARASRNPGVVDEQVDHGMPTGDPPRHLLDGVA